MVRLLRNLHILFLYSVITCSLNAMEKNSPQTTWFDVAKYYVGGNGVWYLSSLGSPTLTETLIAATGANLDMVNSKGRTLLILAARNSNQTDIHTLLRHKANVRIRDYRGKTALHWAMGEKEITMHDVAAHGFRYAIAKALIEAGAPINDQDFDGNTPLHFAARYGLSKIITLLLDNKAAINMPNLQGRTPLMDAVYNKQDNCLDVVKLLIAHKADYQIQDNDKLTPLLHAARADNIKAVNYLQSLVASSGTCGT